MIYAAIIVCHMQGCVGLTDDLSPHETQEACVARLDEMRQGVVAIFSRTPGARMRAICAPLDEVRRLIPDAFPGAEVEVDA
jgi:hypothetical protein